MVDTHELHNLLTRLDKSVNEMVTFVSAATAAAIEAKSQAREAQYKAAEAEETAYRLNNDLRAAKSVIEEMKNMMHQIERAGD